MATTDRRTKRDLNKNKLRAGLCGAKTQRGGRCRQPAGAGTGHKGIGKCAKHGGTLISHRKHGYTEEAIQFMGAPKDINPLDAIIWCIKITAGEVEWLSQQIAEIAEEDWLEDTLVGKQLHVFQRSRAQAQDRLVRYSKEAISLGLAERAVRLAEQFGVTIARLLEGIASEMHLNAAQKRQWPMIVRKHLILLEGGQTVTREDMENLPAIIEGSARRA